MRIGHVGLVLGLMLSALTGCGGDEAAPPPATPPAPPPVASPATPAPTQTVATPAPAPKPTMAELQAATGKATMEAMATKDAKKFAATFAEDGVWNMVGVGEMKGRAEIEKQIQGWFDGFKDMKFGFSRSWSKGDMAAFEWGWTGTHSAEFMGMKATEKPAGAMGVSLVWFNPDGTVKRNNHYVDTSTIMTQLTGKGKARPVPTLAANMDSWAAKGTPEEDKNVEAWKTMMNGFAGKKEADFLATVSDDIEWSDMAAPESHKGKADAKKAYQMMSKAFPDAKFTPTASMGVGDMAIVEYTMSGTHKGALMGKPATNKPVNAHGIAIVQIKDGKVAKGWDYMNSMEMAMQLGWVKAPTAAKTDAKPGEAKKPEAKPGDAKKPEAKPADAKKPEAKPADTKKPEAKKPEAKPAEKK
ncbi:MAG: ester cyclase [Myxococcales bacterium]|nr:ester cyclase [Myxococcales bacterium]